MTDSQCGNVVAPRGVVSIDRTGQPRSEVKAEAAARKAQESVVPAANRPVQAFEALGSEQKAGMRANKILRDEAALQEAGEPFRRGPPQGSGAE